MIERTGIIYLQKDKFDFFYPPTGKMIEFKFVGEIIKDLEIINQELLENLIKLFVTSSKLIPCDLAIVIADNASFVRDFRKPIEPVNPTPNANPQAQARAESMETILKPEMDQFIEHVPFDDVTSLTFPLNNGIKVWATNKMFYQAIADSFERLGFKIHIIVPALVFSTVIGNKTTFDFVMANAMLQQLDLARQHNLLGQKIFVPVAASEGEKNREVNEGVEIDNVDLPQKPTAKKSNKRLFLMLGIFIVLIIVLVLVYIGSLSQT